MASTVPPPIRTLSIHCVRNAAPSSSCKAHASKPAPAFPLSGRRQLLFFLTASTALTARERTSKAQDIPLFGLRKNLRKVEEEAEEIVREGFEAADRGLQTAERGLETAERGVEAAEKGIEEAEREISSAVSFGGLAQAGVVAGAEFLGILVATAIVNGILGPEAQKS
ncbi:synechocystis YCF37-like protein [Senna tora]|uniref:Synechocystis YCF37-like protein n=1 Tax=Senna tora TaxID=362788 RepID=A0A834T535_9FABA|nr:synechocystis YCF37-like protein [Senna tora]